MRIQHELRFIEFTEDIHNTSGYGLALLLVGEGKFACLRLNFPIAEEVAEHRAQLLAQGEQVLASGSLPQFFDTVEQAVRDRLAYQLKVLADQGVVLGSPPTKKLRKAAAAHTENGRVCTKRP